MKKTIIITTLLSSLIFVLGGCENTSSITTIDSEGLDSYTESLETYQASDIDNPFGSAGALSDDAFTLEEMLVYAIEDEYAARTEYEYILNTFDVTRPFSNIIKAEVTHIELLLPLFEEYDIDLPEDTSSNHLIEVTDLQATYETGVIAEELNIAMYNLFLEQEGLPQDVIDTFIKLRNASISHLGAFQKQIN